mmetsp:Transcript_121308/g.350307  ORF Transcript_121308/g.350307 Transcript_121308/m.350307 type:complete len:257 (+) Transcript_121308:982-1752(+)
MLLMLLVLLELLPLAGVLLVRLVRLLLLLLQHQLAHRLLVPVGHHVAGLSILRTLGLDAAPHVVHLVGQLAPRLRRGGLRPRRRGEVHVGEVLPAPLDSGEARHLPALWPRRRVVGLWLVLVGARLHPQGLRVRDGGKAARRLGRGLRRRRRHALFAHRAEAHGERRVAARVVRRLRRLAFANDRLETRPEAIVRLLEKVAGDLNEGVLHCEGSRLPESVAARLLPECGEVPTFIRRHGAAARSAAGRPSHPVGAV